MDPWDFTEQTEAKVVLWKNKTGCTFLLLIQAEETVTGASKVSDDHLSALAGISRAFENNSPP